MFAIPAHVQQQVERFFTTPVQVRSKTRTVAPDGTLIENYVTRVINCLIAPRQRGTLRGEREYRVVDDLAVVVYTHRTETINLDDEIDITGKWLRVSMIYPNRDIYLAFLAIGDKTA